MAKLNRYRRNQISLNEAVDQFLAATGEAKATGILYTPRRCLVVRIRRGSDGPVFEHPKEQPVNAYEARVFTAEAELRWLNDPTPTACHRAVVISEKDLSEPVASWNCDELLATGVLDQQYLLWGETDSGNQPDGWVRLSAARVGAYWIPMNARPGPKQQIRLLTREYLGRAQYGNVVVAEERLVGFELEGTVPGSGHGE